MKHSVPSAIFAAAMLMAILSGCQSPPTAAGEAVRSNLFLSNFIVMRELEFPGWVDDAFTPENPFEGESLVMHVREAGSRSAHVALYVGEDRSRTWVLTTQEDGRLHLRHDHRDPDGTPHDLTDYGGVALPETSHDRRSFAADEFTATLIPEAATNVWTMKFDRDAQTFTYDLTRHGRPRFRAVFDLTQGRLVPQ